jgi:hypothetical protein
MESNPIIAEIDLAHTAANFALKNKDFNSYINYFSNDLQYKQLNGKTIDKKQLSKDTQQYFSRIKNYTGKYQRLNFTFDNGIFTETLIQQATVAIRIFIFFTKHWTVERKGIYKWRKENSTWQITDVIIMNEKIS